VFRADVAKRDLDVSMLRMLILDVANVDFVCCRCCFQMLWMLF
jgi:hypothetical protein